MQDLETLTTEDMMQIFHLARISIYRRIREAREGRGQFPIPIQTGTKRRLRWNMETVRNFMQNADSPSQTSSTLKMESAKSRQTRHAEAMKKLECFGIKTAKHE
jgi:predicted DNA-binding transcriptional regulator AlpA